MSHFFLTGLGMLCLFYSYIGWRFIRPAPLGRIGRVLAWTAIVVLAALPPLLLSMRRATRGGSMEPAMANMLAWVGYLSLGFISLLFLVLLARDVGWVTVLAVRKVTFLARRILTWSDPVDPWDPERRRFLVNTMNVGVLGISSALTGYGLIEARQRPRVAEVLIPIPGLPADLDGFRIVQITDLHVGDTIRRSFVERVVEEANGLEADIAVFTGDLVDGSVPQLRDDVAPMGDLVARQGRYFVTGNHEYYSGALPWIEEARRLGFDVLINEHRLIRKGTGRVLLAGVTDYSAGNSIPSQASDPRKAVAGAAESDVRVLLAHQPRSMFAAADVGFDVQLSGHTHGGQYFPWHLLVAEQQPYLSGLHTFRGMRVYVSRGSGYWGPPLRIGAPSEVTLVRLLAVGREG